MKRVGALTESAALSHLVPARGPARERAATDAARDARVPWLLVLLPVVLLVLAGLLTLILTTFVAMPAGPTMGSSFGDARDLGEGDASVLHVGPAHTR
jgi:hypothetical protein